MTPSSLVRTNNNDDQNHTNTTCNEQNWSLWRGAAQTFIQKSNAYCFLCWSKSLPLPVSSFIFSPHGWLKAHHFAAASIRSKKTSAISSCQRGGQTSSPTYSITSIPSIPFDSSHSSIITSIFFYLILRHYSHLPLSVNYVLFLVILLPQWSHDVLFSVSDSAAVSSQLFYKPGSRTDSDATLQVAVTLLR